MVHPFPSFLNAALVLAIAYVAGAEPVTAALLSCAMLGLQFCIGAVNDLFDQESDALSKPWKPIPAGLVSRRTGGLVAVLAGGGGLALAAIVGLPVLVMAAAMLAAGLVYDAFLKPTALSWAAFAVAFPILPVYAWYGAAGTLPPLPEFLLPVAALAGPALNVANGLVDLEGDAASGQKSLAVRLGRRRSLVAVVGLMVVIHGLAWATLPHGAPPPVGLIVGLAGTLALVGTLLLAHQRALMREAGWASSAASIAVLGVGWLLAVTG